MRAVATVLMLSAGLCWSATYLLIIRQGMRDRTYGMPIVALCANISWELIFSFAPSQLLAQRVINVAWLGLDAVIWWQALRFGPREFPRVPRRVFYAMFGLAQATAFGTVLAVTYEFEDWKGYYAAYGQSLLMSALFLAMLASRGSLRGQSMSIAVTKLFGTVFVSIAFTVYPLDHGDSVLLPFLYVVCAVLDVAYVVAVFLVGRAERTGAPAAGEAGEAGAANPANPASGDAPFAASVSSGRGTAGGSRAGNEREGHRGVD
ncbi:MAG TPA: hypothetical protein VFM54_17590 [Micromonosporaceae bacterium]|nr:hypothetical protein [Micromonosporaceae bacterium]